MHFLLRLAGGRKLAILGLLMLVSSLTEGLGLLMLVPITQLVAGGPVAGAGRTWLADLAGLPIEVLLCGFVALVTLRAGLVHMVLGMRRALSLSLTRELRVRLQEAIFAARWQWLSAQRSGDHAGLIVGEAARVGIRTEQALDLVVGAVTLLVLLASALYLSWQLTLASLLLGLVAAGLLVLARERHGKDADAYSEAYLELERHVSNGLAHLRAARIAGAQGSLLADFTATAGRLELLEARYHRGSSNARRLLQIVAAIMLALLVYAALRVFMVPVALLVPTLAIFARTVPILGSMQEGLRAWQFSRPAFVTMLAFIAEARAEAEPQTAGAAMPPLREAITLRDVTMTFPGRERPVLAGFSHTFRAGQVIAVAGPSGSGKSTLADMICGLIAPDAGQILIDGAPLDAEGRIRWRRQVAYVEQMPYLFDASIARNVAWGQPAADPQAIRAALEAASAQFVFDLPRGIDTPVGELGRQLSGGERQRISLARALMKKPSLIVLDEVTSALDTGNEDAIAGTIRRMRGTCTFLILGHRTALLELADDLVDLGAMAGAAT